MGYIRLIKSGGRRCLADATCFIRDFKNIDELTDLLDKQTVPELTQKAASCLKRDTKNLVSNFEEATEYFKVYFVLKLNIRYLFSVLVAGQCFRVRI